MVIRFELDGEEFMALNGGPQFKFTEAISLVVNCKNQAEVDHYWDELSQGGQAVQCGWLKDKFGLSWQIVPTILGELMEDKDPQRRERVMKAMMQMVKLDVDGLARAARD
jgi:predicted 3-demethylubiquinone-9 3-methyltransferase (glyoxalase superfamily)